MAAFILLDTETTGAGPSDRLCQIAFLVAEGKAPLRAVESFCKPPLPIGFGAMAVHHITNEMVADKPPYNESEAAAALDALNLPENVLIIHNAPFDVEMLRREGVLWKGPVIDTLRCARHLIDEVESHALQHLRYALGFYKDETAVAESLGAKIAAHDALGDVIVLYLLMKHLMGLVGKNGDGVSELIRLSNEPVLLKKFRFGKYRGMAYEEVAKSDPGYMDWLLKSEMQKEEPDEDLRHTLQYYLQGGKR